MPFKLLMIAWTLVMPPFVWAGSSPNMQHAALKEEKKSADQSAAASTAMAVVHGVVSATCFTACATVWLGAWGEGACVAGSLGAGVTDLIATQNVASAGMSGAMFVINMTAGGGGTSLYNLATSLGLTTAKDLTTGATSAGSVKAQPVNGNGTRSASQNMSCVTGAVSAAQAVMAGMAANDAKKTSKAAQQQMGALEEGTPPPSMSSDPGMEEMAAQENSPPPGIGGINFPESGQVSENTASSPSSASANRNGTTTGGNLNAGPCGNISTYQNAVACARANDPRIPESVADPRFEELFKKLTGQDPVSYFKDKDMAQAIGGAVGNPGLLNTEGLKQIAKLVDENSRKGIEGIGVASGGGGGGKKGGGEDDNGLAALFAAAKDAEGKGGEGFARQQFGQAERDLASLSPDDPRVSIFDRITLRYQIVTKRWLSPPADAPSDPKKL